jgi:hypothetical protein
MRVSRWRGEGPARRARGVAAGLASRLGSRPPYPGPTFRRAGTWCCGSDRSIRHCSPHRVPSSERRVHHAHPHQPERCITEQTCHFGSVNAMAACASRERSVPVPDTSGVEVLRLDYAAPGLNVVGVQLTRHPPGLAWLEELRNEPRGRAPKRPA